MGILNLENEPGLKSKISACGPSIHSRRTGVFLSIAPNVLVRRLLREPKQMYAQFKLSIGSPHRDKQDLIEISVIVGPAGAYQARMSSQNGSHSVVSTTKSQKKMELDVQHEPQKTNNAKRFLGEKRFR